MEEILTKNGLDKFDYGKVLLDVMYAAEDDQIIIDGTGAVEVITADGARKKTVLNAGNDAAMEDEQPMVDDDN